MSGNLQFNKIMAAGLTAALVIVVARVGVDALYHTEPPAKPGYAVEVAEAEAGGGAAAVELDPDWGTVLPTADLAAGEKAFGKCVSCHNVDPANANMTGPGLWGVVGRATAGHAGFAYSDGMKAHAAEAPTWTYDELYHFLGNPAKWVKGTKMGFAGIKKPEERIALIAYLHSKGSTGYPIPAPDPSRQPGAAPAAAGAAPAQPAEAAAAPATAASPASAKAAPAASAEAPADAQ
ncbi:c-type cytochrome [Asticcacaulis excentricus]|uniref:Membrane c-type cytochrome cy n=1 Tax=Asticcacaulis excentricus TaxID=78587 RepID=A0A3G9G109_9CAUL|nr:cytochrome c family protein [Asticcacaulis excentricus]BBF80990.1 membrane c-type cytochrome cy [Asticcacaulis excentricus]